MIPKKYIIAGIGTEVGKTVVSAIVTQKLKAHYWKPIQAGDLHQSDTIKVTNWVSNKHSIFYPEAYQLNHPMSPHAAADLDNVCIELSKLTAPQTSNNLVIELAGGLLVPLNHKETNLNFIQQLDIPVILVVNFYLGSINHTLLSIELLKSNGIEIAGLIFNGHINIDSKNIILKMTGCTNLGTVPKIEGQITPQIIDTYGKHIEV